MSLNQPQAVDWHTHSTASDGELTPLELVLKVKAVGLTQFALTDHDTLAGIAVAREAAQQHGVGLLPGVEISSSWSNQDIHIVGLGVETDNAALIGHLDEQMRRREQRAQAIGIKLEKLGYDGIFEAASQLADRGIPARPHFAKALVEAGVCKDKKQAFQRFLAVSKPAYVKTPWPSVEQVVGWIREAQGDPVLAHPGRYKLTRSKLERLVNHFCTVGGQALEVSVATHSADVIQHLADLSVKYALYASQGSDYHGPSMRWVNLGKMPPMPSRCQPVSELIKPSMYLS